MCSAAELSASRGSTVNNNLSILYSSYGVAFVRNVANLMEDVVTLLLERRVGIKKSSKVMLHFDCSSEQNDTSESSTTEEFFNDVIGKTHSSGNGRRAPITESEGKLLTFLIDIKEELSLELDYGLKENERQQEEQQREDNYTSQAIAEHAFHNCDDGDSKKADNDVNDVSASSTSSTSLTSSCVRQHRNDDEIQNACNKTSSCILTKPERRYSLENSNATSYTKIMFTATNAPRKPKRCPSDVELEKTSDHDRSHTQIELDNPEEEDLPALETTSDKNPLNLTRTNNRSTMKDGQPKRWRRKSVSFDTVEVRYYQRILSDNPCCKSGSPSIGIDWNYDENNIQTYRIDTWELMRTDIHFQKKNRNSDEFALSKKQKTKLLLNELGYSNQEIISNIRSVNKVKQQRRRTINNIKFENMESAFEEMKKKLTRPFSPSRQELMNKQTPTQKKACVTQ